jgi:Na+-driven multidrug efflux pump
MRKLRIYKQSFAEMLKIGVPAGVQSGMFSIANIVIQLAINKLDTIVMAGSSAGYNIEIIAYFCLSSFAQACSTFVSQNNGANRIDRCKKTLLVCLCEGACCLVLVVGVLGLFGKPILSVFNSNPQVIDIGYMRLTYVMIYSYLFILTYDVLACYLRGFGISTIPAVLTTVGICVVRILWVFIRFPQNPVFETIMQVYPISLSLTAILMLTATLILRPAKKRLKF